jgi:2-oxoglutarate dehydrogenase E2 component (dihydrolipoamide succinyltransferase)
MAKFELKLPKMGESVAEATITNWLKNVGDKIEQDEAVLEIATDKVDSEVPSEVSGILIEQLFTKDDVVKVGQTIAIIETEGGSVETPKTADVAAPIVAEVAKTVEVAKETVAPADFSGSDKFFSPLVKNIAKEEGVSVAELESISGSGKDGRVTKEDILKYVASRKQNTGSKAVAQPVTPSVVEVAKPVVAQPTTQAIPVSVNGGDEIIEMDRMRKLISQYMVASVQTSAHVQSFIEVDVTNIVKWRDKVKTAFEKREGEKLTFTPIFMEAVAKALKDFPMMNISVEGEYIIKKKNIQFGNGCGITKRKPYSSCNKKCRSTELGWNGKSRKRFRKQSQSRKTKTRRYTRRNLHRYQCGNIWFCIWNTYYQPATSGNSCSWCY